ncbi:MULTISPECIES: helix-hairpin-helix domain-containing protein [unclassified Spirosoma]|uniref:ComEA family DNA-binding protein n=1 Tax=unclassified Spirosoma TaxID=2621999 RepID=UPI00096A02B2|nr:MULTISPECIES: helix-hairpin-helix domain-containing protein [unclassified Spirosoma]MBN8826072.1 helix-hairpin-helix domain-containing protein [Spirosoma sp.]OJW75523.1 MAG: transporter [Spirosoma sp. 48-14]
MLNRFQALIRDYFGLSHKEARGFLVLLFLSVLLLLIPFVYRFFADRKPIDSSPADQRKLDSLVAIMQAEEAKQPRYGSRSEKEKTTSEHFSEPKLFPFDPNTATVAQWQQLGLPRWLAERIEKFRSKGGQFRKKDDLLRIYDFPPELYDQLEPYITLKEAPSKQSFGSKPYSTEAPTSTERPALSNRSNAFERPAKPVLQPFDINTADTSQLIALKGIGGTLAGRIVKFRDALGGFVSTEQYRDIYGLDSLALEELLKFGKVQSGVRKIPINTATADELDRHPFLSRRQAQIIVNYREQHGAYTSAESLKPIRVLDAKTIEKLAPYLEF